MFHFLFNKTISLSHLQTNLRFTKSRICKKSMRIFQILLHNSNTKQFQLLSSSLSKVKLICQLKHCCVMPLFICLVPRYNISHFFPFANKKSVFLTKYVLLCSVICLKKLYNTSTRRFRWSVSEEFKS